jgi:hypothetical protein
VPRRLGLWLGVPLAFLLVTCCCCCCCCLLCGASKQSADEAEGGEHQLVDDSRLLDISAIPGDDISAQPPKSTPPQPLNERPLESAPSDPFGTPLGQSPPPQRASSRCSSSGTRALRRARSATHHSTSKQRSERYITEAHQEDYPSDYSPSPSVPLGSYRINEAGQAVPDHCPPYCACYHIVLAILTIAEVTMAGLAILWLDLHHGRCPTIARCPCGRPEPARHPHPCSPRRAGRAAPAPAAARQPAISSSPPELLR